MPFQPALMAEARDQELYGCSALSLLRRCDSTLAANASLPLRRGGGSWEELRNRGLTRLLGIGKVPRSKWPVGVKDYENIALLPYSEYDPSKWAARLGASGLLQYSPAEMAESDQHKSRAVDLPAFDLGCRGKPAKG
jgi:hypothetical protein